MARLPDKSSRFLLISVFVLCCTFLFLDFRFNSFKPVQNFYNSTSIFLKIFSRELLFSPFNNTISATIKSSSLRKENQKLKEELNYQLIKNYVILNNEILNENFFSRQTNHDNNHSELIPAKVASFDVGKYFCCDKHRVFLTSEVNEEVESYQVVINHEGIVGQTIKINQNLFEVILLSDKSHKIPLQSENNFYCEASGSGKPMQVFCDIDLTLGEILFERNQKFFSSGLGGIFPKGIEIGSISSIEELSSKEIRIIINLKANPLSSNFFGVIK